MNCFKMNVLSLYVYCRSAGKAASPPSLLATAVSSKPAAATGGPPVAARNRPVMPVMPKQAAVPQSLPPSEDLIYEDGN